MRTRPPYTPCKLYYDSPRRVAEGDYLQSPTGTSYQVTGVRESKTHPTRQHLKCLRWPKDEIPEGATVHPICWYRRKPKTRRLSDLGQRHDPR